MRIKILPDTKYVAVVFVEEEMNFFKGKTEKEAISQIQDMVRKIADVRNLPFGLVEVDKNEIIVQWFGEMENEAYAVKTMQDFCPVVKRNYRRWVNIPMLELM